MITPPEPTRQAVRDTTYEVVRRHQASHPDTYGRFRVLDAGRIGSHPSLRRRLFSARACRAWVLSEANVGVGGQTLLRLLARDCGVVNPFDLPVAWPLWTGSQRAWGGVGDQAGIVEMHD